MEMRIIQSRDEWESFVSQAQEKSFLHSWEWGEFALLMGEKIWRYGFYDAGALCAVALVEKKSAKRGTFLLIPHGPLLCSGAQTKLKHEVLRVLLKELRDVAKEEGASFVRVNPIWNRNDENIRIFKDLGFRDAPLQMHPEASWRLNIAPLEEVLMAGMRKTTRYLIRHAQNNPDISVAQSASEKDVETFSALHKEVSKRQRFVPFSTEYLKKEFAAFSRNDAVRIVWGMYKEKIVAGAFVIFKGDTAFYHHAISLPEFAKLSVPYLVQWEAIKEAKRRNCSAYDFWGFVDPILQPRHPWAGPTLFKMGFGGKAHLYVTTHDFPLRWTYWLTFLLEVARRKKRHL